VIRAARFATVCLLVLAGAAGCGGGGSSGSGGPDPATTVPANAGLYFEAAVRPEGNVKDDALAATGKILGTSTPEKTLRDFFNKNAKDANEKPLNWDRDVAPWLGQRAGGWAAVTSNSDQADHFVIALSVTDKDKAADFIKRTADKGRKGSYKGVDYTIGSGGNAVGLSGDFILVGSEPELKRSIDAQKGASLAENKRFKDAIGKLDKDRLGAFYVDIKTLIDAGLAANPAERQNFDQFRRIFPIDQLGPITGAFKANGSRLKFDSSIAGQGSETLSRLGLLSGAGSTKLLGELPGESWAAYGAPNVGKTAAGLFDRFAGALGGAALAGQVQQATGLDLRNDIFNLIGDIAIFARGSTMNDLDGGLIVSVTDDGRAATVFGKLVGLLRTQGQVDPHAVKVAGADQAFSVAIPNAPKPIVLARGKGKLVVAYGEAAASASFQPKTKLKDSTVYKQAKASMDNEFDPAFLFSMDGILKVVDGFGGGTDPDFQKARPYLERFSVIASGGKAGKNRYDATLGAGLR
jgi:uncharacterized protein DUF3352